MDFSPTVTYHAAIEVFNAIGGYCALLLFAASLCAVVSLSWTGKIINRVSRISGIIAAVTILGGVTSVIVMGTEDYKAVNEQRNANLVSNLKMKYIINDVDWNVNSYQDISTSLRVNGVESDSADSQHIIIVTTDDKKVIFRLTQDKETSEPTLAELPTAGMIGNEPGSVPLVEITR